MDEATNSVDTRTEKNIQEAMQHLMEGRLSLVIAHRLSAIQDVEAILVIYQVEINERGRHEFFLGEKKLLFQHVRKPAKRSIGPGLKPWQVGTMFEFQDSNFQ